jgi:hypothetical protein
MVFSEIDPFGDSIKLTDERWQHILTRHPEMSGHLDNLRLTIKEPNTIYRSQIEPTEYHFYRLLETNIGQLYLIAIVIKTAAPFIVTAHFVSSLRKGGKLVWLRR